MRIRHKRAVSGKMIYQFTDYPAFELHFRGSDYQVRKNNKIVKYLDGANGHDTCLKDAYKYIRQRAMKNNNKNIKKVPTYYYDPVVNEYLDTGYFITIEKDTGNIISKEQLEIPILSLINEKTRKKVYDLEEMANDFKNKLNKLTESTVMCSILED